jgi:hypothetical protein
MKLPSARRPSALVAVNRDGEASLSIHEAGNPARIERKHRPDGFLLIVRTGRIVTAHADILNRGCDINQYRRILGVSSI